MPDTSLAGKVAIVTGGSAGIGEAVSRRLAALGARVCPVSNVPDDLERVRSDIERAGGQATPFEVDLGDRQQVGSLVERVGREAGPVDILVNNAGIGLHKLLLETVDADFDRLFQINFFSAVRLSRDALQVMSERGRGGSIVNVSSASARRGLSRMTAYAATKGAMHTFSQALRLEAAPHGVRVSEVLPISVQTRFFEAANYRPQGWVQTPEQVAGMVVDCVLKGTPEVCTSRLTGLGFALEALAPNLVSRVLELLEQRRSAD